MRGGLQRFFVFTCLLCFYIFSPYHGWAQNIWDGQDVVGNFSNSNNWDPDGVPSNWNGFTILYFRHKYNPNQSSLYQDIGWKTVESIIYETTFEYGVPLIGNGSSGFNFGWKIENTSYHPQVIKLPLSFNGLDLQLNPVNEDLTIDSIISNSGNKNYNVWGGNSKVLYLNWKLIGNESVSLYINQYSKVAIGYNNSTGSFGGGVYINTGELWFQSGSAINGGIINLGSSGNTAKLYIKAASGSTTVPNNVVVVAGSTPTIGGLNTSGTNTYSGLITLNNAVTLETWGGGTVDYTGDVSGNYPVAVSRVSVSGTGTTKYSVSSKSYTGTTTINDGATLVLNTPSALSSSNDITLLSGGVLQISADQSLRNIDLPTGSTLIIDPGKTLTINGTWSGGGTINNQGTIILVGPTAFPGTGTTITSMNNLTINRASGVKLDKSILIDSTLHLQTGNLDIDTVVLTMGHSAPAIQGVFSASCMIIADGGGKVRRNATNAAEAGYFFPIGDDSGTLDYSPLQLFSPPNDYSGFISVSVINQKHPNNNSVNNYINRYWPISYNGFTSDKVIALATYVNGDIIGYEDSITTAMYPTAFPWIKYDNLVNGNLRAEFYPSFYPQSDMSGVARPFLTISADPDFIVCVNDPLTLTATATGTQPITFLWMPTGDITSSITPLTDIPGTYYYFVTITDGNGLKLVEENITVVVVDAAGISGPNTGICQGDKRTYFSMNGPGLVYKWVAIGGTIIGSDTTEVVTVLWTDPVAGKLTLTQTLGACHDSYVLDVSLIPAPTPSLIYHD